MAERSMCANRLAINLPNVAHTPMAQYAQGFETLNLDDGPDLAPTTPQCGLTTHRHSREPGRRWHEGFVCMS